MLETFKTLIGNQFEATLCTLDTCVDMCPENAWSLRIGRYPFNQVVFHALFFADYYLGIDPEALRPQPFHREHAGIFDDYEQLEDRAPVGRYERAFIKEYLQHCRSKAARVITAETADSLSARAAFQRRDHSRAELHVYNIRHLQHHAAQLSLRLRIDADQDVPWIGSGWQSEP